MVTWPFTNLFILRKWCGFEKPNHHYFKIWPTNRFSKAKSCNFHFHKNDVTYLSIANGLFIGSRTCFEDMLKIIRELSCHFFYHFLQSLKPTQLFVSMLKHFGHFYGLISRNIYHHVGRSRSIACIRNRNFLCLYSFL